MKKKGIIRTMVLGLVMVSALAFGKANEADAAKYKGFVYQKNGKNVTITDYTGTESEVTIPSKIAGKKVTIIGNKTFKDNHNIKKVIMPDTVKKIEYAAFKNCSKLKKITLSDNLVRIGSVAFEECTSLEKINLPAKVERIEYAAFKNCKKLGKVGMSAGVTQIPEECFMGCKSLKSFQFGGIDEIQLRSFADCEGLAGELDLSKVSEVGLGAFDNCTNITGVKFADTLQILGGIAYGNHSDIQGEKSSNPFGGCTSLMNIDIPATNVNFMSSEGIVYGKSGEWLVAYPAGRTGEYTISDRVRGIGEAAFEGSMLTKITVPDSVNFIYGYAFKDSMITAIKLPDCKKIVTEYQAEGIFDGCSKLESFAFPEGMTDNSIITLKDCTSLKTVTFPSTFKELKGEVFKGCTSLNNVVLPESVDKIPARCFFGCESLSNINLNNIGTFGTEAFYGCTALSGKLELSSAGEIRGKAFAECSGITEVTLAVSTSAIGIKPSFNSFEMLSSDEDEYDSENGVAWNSVLTFIPYETDTNAFAGCSALEKINVPEGNLKYTSVDGCLYTKDMKNLICVPAKKTGKYTVPYGVNSICAMAFYGSNVDSIELSNSVRKIETSAFAKCAMRTLTISKSVNRIDQSMYIPIFTGCKNLEEINVKAGNSYFESKDGILYRKSGSHKELICYPAAKKGKEYKTPKKCDISEYAFDGCKYLKKITIRPESGMTVLPVIVKNCSNIKVYLPNKVKKIKISYDSTFDKYYAASGANTKKCTVYVKKNAKIIKKLKTYDVNYKLY